MHDNESITLSDARQMQAILGDLENDLPAQLKVARLGELITKVDNDIVALKQLRSQTTALVAQKKASIAELKEFMKRVRSGAKAVFGDDSLEYERVGGTRSSERKRPARKTESAATAS